MELNTHRWGAGRTRVLLIHGICSSGATWWEIAAGIEDATVIAPTCAATATARGRGAIAPPTTRTIWAAGGTSWSATRSAA